MQSHYFSVGSVVSWAEAGVGAVATQSVVEPAYGPRGLELMRAGASAPDALRRLLGEDDAEAVRQVAFIDAGGRTAVHTGARCIREAGHQVADGVSVQANMMERPTVPGAMLEAFRAADGELAAAAARRARGRRARGRRHPRAPVRSDGRRCAARRRRADRGPASGPARRGPSRAGGRAAPPGGAAGRLRARRGGRRAGGGRRPGGRARRLRRRPRRAAPATPSWPSGTA